ncbi:MAG: hypothetical protein MJA27_18245 [Pseudanabaenales cyanobacterium]|nr:hypothetical protein [Pseudanabaenales cyanobacterium]
MTSEIEDLIVEYRQKGILVDTNILFLYFVGAVNRERISKFKRTNQFIPEDYDLLLGILKNFQRMVTTSNILTEVNSLSNQLGEPQCSQCFALFSQAILPFEEYYIESRNTASNEAFIRFGLTDCGIINLAREQYLVLNDDLKLASYLQRQRIDTVNFNNLRVYGWS